MPVSITFVVSSKFLSVVSAVFWANTDPRSGGCHKGVLTRQYGLYGYRRIAALLKRRLARSMTSVSNAYGDVRGLKCQ